MRFCIPSAAIIALTFASAGFAQRPIAAEDLPRKDAFHVFLLMGQDNMSGRGEMVSADRKKHKRVLKLNGKNQWVGAAEPLHWDKKTLVGVGPGMAFARRIVELDEDVTVGLIPCAVGGSALKRWEKGGDLYLAAVARAKAAIKHGTLKGVLWHHGELDARRRLDAFTYEERLVSMIADFRNDVGDPKLPFVLGELGRFIRLSRLPYADIINKAVRATATRVPNVAVVSSADLTRGRKLEFFDADSARMLGKRYHQTMRGMWRQRGRRE